MSAAHGYQRERQRGVFRLADQRPLKMRQRRGDTSTSAKEGYLHRLQSAPAAQKHHEKVVILQYCVSFSNFFGQYGCPGGL